MKEKTIITTKWYKYSNIRNNCSEIKLSNITNFNWSNQALNHDEWNISHKYVVWLDSTWPLLLKILWRFLQVFICSHTETILIIGESAEFSSLKYFKIEKLVLGSNLEVDP